MTSQGSDDKSDRDHKICQRRLLSLVESNKTVQFLIGSIEDLGCKIPEDFVSCRKCDFKATGGLTLPRPGERGYKPKIVICENQIADPDSFQQTVMHELIHAYDMCRAKVNFGDCKHVACTEVRASSLSGECGFYYELYRGHFMIAKGHQECVRRRAALSLSVNPKCKNGCSDHIEDAMASCYEDKHPFSGYRWIAEKKPDDANVEIKKDV